MFGAWSGLTGTLDLESGELGDNLSSVGSINSMETDPFEAPVFSFSEEAECSPQTRRPVVEQRRNCKVRLDASAAFRFPGLRGVNHVLVRQIRLARYPGSLVFLQRFMVLYTRSQLLQRRSTLNTKVLALIARVAHETFSARALCILGRGADSVVNLSRLLLFERPL